MTTPNIDELIDRLYDWHNTSAEQNRLDMQKAADLLQSQAERIKALEQSLQTGPEIITGLFARAANMEKERDTLRAQLVDAELHTKQVERGLDKATAQLAEIEKTEPALVVEKEPDYWSVGHFHEGSRSYIKPTKVWSLPIGTKLFTRPMPAQDVTELVGALQLFAYALPLDKSTVKTCYAVNNQMRDAAHAALSKFKGAK